MGFESFSMENNAETESGVKLQKLEAIAGELEKIREEQSSIENEPKQEDGKFSPEAIRQSENLSDKALNLLDEAKAISDPEKKGLTEFNEKALYDHIDSLKGGQ